MNIWKYFWSWITGDYKSAVPGNASYDPDSQTTQNWFDDIGENVVHDDITPPSKDDVPSVGYDRGIDDLAEEYDIDAWNGQNGFGTFLKSLQALIPSLVNRISAYQLTGAEREQNAFNAEQAQIDRDFQERMASSQYQRGVADMQAAGVNPALAMSNGGAAAPAGSSAAGSGSGAFNTMSDIMQLFMLKPQIELMREQGLAARTNSQAAKTTADANMLNAKTREREVGLQEEELRTVKQPLAVSQIKINDSVVELNDAQRSKVWKELDLVVQDTEESKLRQLAEALDITYKLDIWDLNKQALAAQIGKDLAQKALNYALSEKASKEAHLAALEGDWKKVFNDYWTDPKNSDRGVNIEMLQGTNLGALGLAYIQAFGDNLQDVEPGSKGNDRKGAPDVVTGR